MNVVTVIPFRKGSKGLKDKAFAVVGGMSLVERTLRQALDWLPWPVVLYTDYTPEEIEGHGCYLSGTPTVLHDDQADQADTHRTLDIVLKDVLAALRASGAAVDALALMTPNTPVRMSHWLSRAAESFLGASGGIDTVFLAEPTWKQMWSLQAVDSYAPLIGCSWSCITSGQHGLRQHKAPEAFIEHTGVFMVSRTTPVEAGRRLGDVAVPVPVKHPWIGLDIHTQRDVDLANYLYDKGEWS